MPRPKRDYGAQLRLDIEKLDAQLRGLVLRRSRLVQMLHDYESIKDTDIDVDAALRTAIGATRTPSKPEPQRRRRR